MLIIEIYLVLNTQGGSFFQKKVFKRENFHTFRLKRVYKKKSIVFGMVLKKEGCCNFKI